MRRYLLVLFVIALSGCSGEDGTEDAAPVCEATDSFDFNADSGWNSAEYCDAPTDLGCFPYHESSADTCGPFTTMRTSATAASDASACVDVLTMLNCGTFTNDGDSELTFNIADADRFTMQMTGTYQGRPADTVLHFNPCHQNCMAAITLETIDPDQQTICEIPRQGKPECLLGEDAHSITFVRADEASIVIRTAGVETPLSRVDDE